MTAPLSPESSRLRLTIVGVIVLSLFAALFARLWYLQVIGAPQAQAAAQSNGVRIVYTPAPRGRVLDRNGTPLVDNKISEVVTITRTAAKRQPAVLTRLAALLNVPLRTIQQKVNDVRYSPYVPVPIAVGIPTSTIIYIKEHQADFIGVDATAEAERSYPFGSVAANIVGYVGQISDKQLTANRKKLGYQQGDQIGQTGVEGAYEDALRGQPGITKLQVDSRGRVLGVLATQAPVQGHDLWLSVDINVQKLAEESLAQGMAVARLNVEKGTTNHFKAPGGAVTVLDPNTGQVLAMATNPTYDPSDFVNGISTAKFNAYNTDPNHPLNDRTIQGQYAPGSTFKLVTAIAGLRDGIISPGQYFDDKGYLQVGPIKFKNDNGQIYGPVNLQRALTVSSDAYFYNVGAKFWEDRARLGDDGLQNVARELGLGAATGIAFPNEASGRIPDKASRAKEHALYPNIFREGGWFTGDNVNTSIGQGEVAVTPLQLANAYATFANGGTLWQPQIALKLTDQAGNIIQTLPSVATRKVDLPPQFRAPILAGLQGVTAEAAGTARPAFTGFPVAQFPVAGKTGTAQIANQQNTSVFASFAPANNPRYVVDSFIEQGGYGADASAPVVRRIYDGLFNQPLQNVTAPKSGVD